MSLKFWPLVHLFFLRHRIKTRLFDASALRGFTTISMPFNKLPSLFQDKPDTCMNPKKQPLTDSHLPENEHALWIIKWKSVWTSFPAPVFHMPPLMIRYKKIVATILLVSHAILLSAQDSKPSHDKIKAIFLYNLTQFVEWPPYAFKEKDDPLIVGILGEDPFEVYLKEVISGEQTNGHPIVLHHYGLEEDITECHVLYVNLSNPDLLNQTLQNLKGKSILTVSDDAGFLDAGGMIQFINVNNKVHIKINPDASSAADLKLSSRLLHVAEIVTLPSQK